MLLQTFLQLLVVVVVPVAAPRSGADLEEPRNFRCRNCCKSIAMFRIVMFALVLVVVFTLLLLLLLLLLLHLLLLLQLQLDKHLALPVIPGIKKDGRSSQCNLHNGVPQSNAISMMTMTIC